MSPPSGEGRAFVNYLEGLVESEDRAALAALRRGLGKQPGTVAEMHRYVVPWLPAGATRWQEDAYYLIASLFAWHQVSWRPGAEERGATNLGASLARLVAESGDGGAEKGGGGVEKRFVALLNCHPDDLPVHLRQVVSLLKSREIPIDWHQLLSDVQSWGLPTRAVQRRWAKAFWGLAGGAGQAPEERDVAVRETTARLAVGREW